jgi:hypothetical protein
LSGRRGPLVEASRRAYARAEMAADGSFERQEERAQPLAPAHAAPAIEPHPAQALAGTIGNRAFTDVVGAGILPDGKAHPVVESAIGSARGSGASLDGTVRDRFSGPLGDGLADVRVHTDSTADALARSVSARAFVTGNDMFFAAGEYRPSTPDGDRLLAHEVTHVVQQRGAGTTGPLTVSQPGDALERDADRTAGELLG